VFWSDNGAASGIYHVGLYLGDDRMIVAPHSGTDVQVMPLYAGVFPWAVQP
jgi:cell wall-associated NlpC family hydrolase